MENRHFVVELSSSLRVLDFLILTLIVSPTGLKSGQYSCLQFLALLHLPAGVLQFNSLAVPRHPQYNLNMYCTVYLHYPEILDTTLACTVQCTVYMKYPGILNGT